jgi:hypothetical protein
MRRFPAPLPFEHELHPFLQHVGLAPRHRRRMPL